MARDTKDIYVVLTIEAIRDGKVWAGPLVQRIPAQSPDTYHYIEKKLSETMVAIGDLASSGETIPPVQAGPKK